MLLQPASVQLNKFPEPHGGGNMREDFHNFHRTQATFYSRAAVEPEYILLGHRYECISMYYSAA